MLTRRLWRSVIWALFVLILTGLPGNYLPEIVSFWDWLGPDKLVHVFLFGTFSFLLLFDLREQYVGSTNRFRFIVVVSLISMAYGLLTEVLQAKLFIGRDGNLYDFLADTLGAVSGTLVFYIGFRKKIIK